MNIIKTPIFAALLALSPMITFAVEVIPDAGSILQQMQEVAPPAPSSNDTGLKIETPTATKLPMTEAFEVKVIELSGNHAFTTEVLQALVASAIGTKITLPELDALATHITDYYHSHGYPLARASLPRLPGNGHKTI